MVRSCRRNPSTRRPTKTATTPDLASGNSSRNLGFDLGRPGAMNAAVSLQGPTLVAAGASGGDAVRRRT